RFLSEFTVKGFLGRGAFCCVFQAVNKYDNWEYAVKRVAVGNGVGETAFREVRAMAQLDHPNIIRYNSTWVEKPPEGWQVLAPISTSTFKNFFRWMLHISAI
ncbi:hypothetical protein PMAYCL1PPCAC_08464, partial [Pristionchus mayeri]